MAEFKGFYPETIDFLWGIRFNNNREWFTEHKEEYQKYLISKQEKEETLWQSSLKPLHPRLSGKPWMVKAGSAELQVGLGWREVSQCSWSFRGI